MHIAAVRQVSTVLLPALENLRRALDKKANEFSGVIKIGRTHLQDAVPLTLGHEFSGYAAQVTNAFDCISGRLPRVLQVAQGGTAVGTGLNAPAGFATAFSRELASYTGLPFLPATNPFEALAAHDALVDLSGALNSAAASLMKIARDVILLASGPRCGLGEIVLPANEPGSSIMPGKVNPTQAEALAMVSSRVMGNHMTITIAGSLGTLELNTYKPVILHCILQSIRLLSDACSSFALNCVEGIEPDYEQIARHLGRSLMLVTALTPHIGYDKAAKIAQDALARGLSLRDAAIASGHLSGEDFDRWVDPERLAKPNG
jgi:fumarate hydratase class II